MGHYSNQAKLIISTVDYDIARDCWSLVLCLFGMQQVMPQKVIDLLACWKGHLADTEMEIFAKLSHYTCCWLFLFGENVGILPL